LDGAAAPRANPISKIGEIVASNRERGAGEHCAGILTKDHALQSFRKLYGRGVEGAKSLPAAILLDPVNMIGMLDPQKILNRKPGFAQTACGFLKLARSIAVAFLSCLDLKKLGEPDEPCAEIGGIGKAGLSNTKDASALERATGGDPVEEGVRFRDELSDRADAVHFSSPGTALERGRGAVLRRAVGRFPLMWRGLPSALSCGEILAKQVPRPSACPEERRRGRIEHYRSAAAPAATPDKSSVDFAQLFA
jgi:hypothetical protein